MDAREITTLAPAALASGGTRLRGRRSECQALDELVADARAGLGRAVILRGEAGAGKSALLEYLAGRAQDAGCRVISSAGTKPEMEWAFAGLHGLLNSVLDQAERLPVPQRDALLTALGLTAGPSPDRLLLGLAVLSLLSGASTADPLICLVDDAQWLDRASAQALAFAARRLASCPVALVFATRDMGEELAGLPELTIEGLSDGDARALLADGLIEPLDERARELIVAETRGNPRTLVDLSRGPRLAELAGGFGLPDAGVPGDASTDGFAAQLAALPRPSRRFVQLAAADLSGDPSLMWQAARRLGLPFHAAAPAEEAGLVRFRGHARFRHLAERSAAYWSASFADRREMHETLAELTDPVTDPDRRAWHRARAASGPDEEVAAELDRSAGRARARGGLAAAAAFRSRAAALTGDPGRRADRILAAAQASLWVGDFGKSLELLVTAETMALGELASARLELLRGQIAFASGQGSDAPVTLLKAAQQLAQLDAGLAGEAYLSAWMAAQSAGGRDPLEVCHAAGALPCPANPGTRDLLLRGLVLSVTDGPAAAAPVLRGALNALTDADITVEEAFRWGWLAPAAASLLWDNAARRALAGRLIGQARRTGALGHLPFLLITLGTAVAATGDLTSATALAAEADVIRSVTGAGADRDIAMILASMRGHRAEALKLIDATITEAEACGQGIAVARAHWGAAILHNGLGQHEEALIAGRQATEGSTAAPLVAMWALPELVEAAARAGQDSLARDALNRLAEITRSCANDSALGIEARCRALLSEGPAADDLYREAIDRLGRTELRPELARAQLLYGEWLRRERRRTDAREQLRAACGAFVAMGMSAFAERARQELTATGERARRRDAETVTVTTLTVQEALIARLAGDGRSNPEIGAQLFLSPRTVQYHLAKVFAKLGICSRRELRGALRQPGRGVDPASALLAGNPGAAGQRDLVAAAR